MTQSVNFGTKPVGWFTVKTATVINTSSATINRRIAVTRDWDDYSTGLTGSPCPFFEPAPLAPGESCVVLVGSDRASISSG